MDVFLAFEHGKPPAQGFLAHADLRGEIGLRGRQLDNPKPVRHAEQSLGKAPVNAVMINAFKHAFRKIQSLAQLFHDFECYIRGLADVFS